MRGRHNLPVFLGYAAISLLVLAYLVTQMGGDFNLTGAYHLRAMFQTATDLVPGDDVTMSGIRVGKVESFHPSSSGVEVLLTLHGDGTPVYEDARAVIREKNLLGEAYVEVNRGQDRAQPMPDGGRITQDHTLTPVEVDQVLNTLDPQVRDRLAMVINTLGQATAGRGADLNASAGDVQQLAVDLQVISHTLAQSSGNLDALIADLRKVMETIAAWHVQFRGLIANWDLVMQTLASREAALQGTVTEQDRVMTILDTALAGSAPQALHEALATAPSTLANANQYLASGKTGFGVVQQDTPGIAQLFNQLASVMSGVGVAEEAGAPDKGQVVHMWRVYCRGPCFQTGAQTGTQQ